MLTFSKINPRMRLSHLQLAQMMNTSLLHPGISKSDAS